MKRKHAGVAHNRSMSYEDAVDFESATPEAPSHEYTSDEEAEGARSCTPTVVEELSENFGQESSFSDFTHVPALRKLNIKLPDQSKKSKVSGHQKEYAIDSLIEDYILSPKDGLTPLATPLEPQMLGRLYIIMISLHGLVRGDRMELGRDSDTGGQVKYVVELARAMALHPSVHRVDLLTRQIKDPRVDPDYGVEEECISRDGPTKDLGGAYIVRLPCGPVNRYINKEALWPYVREFADRALAHASRILQALADAGRRCELYCVHGHYADAGEAGVLMCATLDSPLVVTGHSLGRNKLEHLLSSGAMTRAEIEATYAISRRIEAEERCLDVAAMVYTSTQQEVDEQWGLYDGYQPTLARVLRFRHSYGRHMPAMKVSPPGLDFSNLKVSIPEDPVLKEFELQKAAMAELEFFQSSTAPSPREAPPSDADAKVSDQEVSAGLSSMDQNDKQIKTKSTNGDSSQVESLSRVASPGAGGSSTVDPFQPGPADIIPNGPPIWQDIARFLRNPLKPAVLAMSRPDAKKNIATLIKAFGEHMMLRELANLVLVMGNRGSIDSMAAGSQKILNQVLHLIDAHDLYGSVAYPKHHTQSDISDIYLFAHETRGVFVNIALQEPFGLTVIEAAAHGVPTVATCNGGPVDIMETLHHGVVVDPTDADAVAQALLSILTDPSVWDNMSSAGRDNIMAYSWPAHCKRYMETMEAEKRFMKNSRRKDRTMSGLLEKRLSRLDLSAFADAAETSQLSSPKPEQADITRYASTPAEYPTTQTVPGGPANVQVIRKMSGLSTDDLGVLESLQLESSRRVDLPERVVSKKHFVVIQLDYDATVPEVAAYINELHGRLHSAGLATVVGIGVLSMLGFDSTYELLNNNKVNVDSELDFVICNAGADVWTSRDDGRWDADENYEKLIDFEWDRISLHRMLKKIISAPAENHRRLPRLKELLYNIAEAPEAGVHPRHICLDLDPETQGILSSGMGPRVREAGDVYMMSAVVERLKRRLRCKGFRCNYTLQMVPNKSNPKQLDAILHITPVRASRPFALRFLANRLGMELDKFTMLTTPVLMQGKSLEDGIVWGLVNDLPDLVGGMQHVVVMKPRESEDLNSLHQIPGVSLSPWMEVDRIELASSDEMYGMVVGSIERSLKIQSR